MISIIICSKDPIILERLRNNIAATVGVDFEIVAVENRETNDGICKVYNAAAKKALFPYLCFIHEDILFHSNNWGRELITLLNNPAIGLAGVSGSVYKSRFPGSWTSCRKDLYRMNTIQHFNLTDPPIHEMINPLKEQYSKVAVIDGVFMASRKSIWEQFPFDEEKLKGFHGYDLDWSLMIGGHFQVVVTYTILLEHFSGGNFSKSWLQDSIILSKKWKAGLPVNAVEQGKADKESDYISCSSLLNSILVNKMGKVAAIWYYLQLVLFFFRYNGFRFTKSVLRYLFLN